MAKEQSQIIDEFLELIKINVSSKDEREIAEALKEKLNKLGLEVKEDDAGKDFGGNTGNIIAKLKGSKDAPTILLSAHMDRVKNGHNIKPQIKEGKIFSDGTTILAADDVAGIVSILDGIRRIKEKGLEHGDIEIVFSVCEEVGVSGTKYLEYSNIKSKMAFVFDSPGRVGRIINQAPAKCKIDITFEGKPAHAGNEPEKGLNAIMVASSFMVSIKEGRINEKTTSNFGVISGGTTTNVVCDKVYLQGEARSVQRPDLDEYLEYLKKKVDEIANRFNTNIDIKIEENYDTFYVNENQKISQILINAMKSIGVNFHFSGGGGGMDANRFSEQGIESLGIATGYSKNHTTEEEIIIEDLIKAGELVERIIIEAAKI